MATNQPINTGATTTTVSRGISGVRIRSPLGLLAALTFLLGIPLAFGCQILFGSGAGTLIHFALAAGSLLLGFSVFDFELPITCRTASPQMALPGASLFARPLILQCHFDHAYG
jgi:hypothetical protein